MTTQRVGKLRLIMPTFTDPFNGSFTFDSFPPDSCPICHHGIQPTWVTERIFACPKNAKTTQEKVAQVIFCCPRDSCGSLFIAEYLFRANAARSFVYMLHRCFPFTPRAYDVEDGVPEVSPSFVQLANEGAAAEAYGLANIAGLGYRKAVEFLIKDYCIKRHPDNAETIKKALLGQCIRDYVEDPKVKMCADRATWLGNDEAHYLRVWIDHDLGDLKNLIKLTQRWIASDLLTKQYEGEMPDKRAATATQVGKEEQAVKGVPKNVPKQCTQRVKYGRHTSRRVAEGFSCKKRHSP